MGLRDELKQYVNIRGATTWIATEGKFQPVNLKSITKPKRKSKTLADRKALYEYNGEKHTLKEWAVIVGIDYSNILNRLLRLDWSLEKSLTTPVNAHRPKRTDHSE
jgi:hypothetical protein